jgi:hypothetical protein
MNYPTLHDGRVTGISLLDGGTAHIQISDVHGKAWKFVLEGLERLRCMEFREGNIILEASAIENETPSSELICALYGIPTGDTPAYAIEKVRAIERGDLVLFFISPSYGCELMALCRSVVLFSSP